MDQGPRFGAPGWGWRSKSRTQLKDMKKKIDFRFFSDVYISVPTLGIHNDSDSRPKDETGGQNLGHL